VTVRNEESSALIGLSDVQLVSDVVGSASRVRQSGFIVTQEVMSRPHRMPDLRSEAVAFLELAGLTVDDPSAALTYAMDLAMKLTGAGTAGLSILHRDAEGVEWLRHRVIAGARKGEIGGSVAREVSSCGICLDEGQTVLVRRPGGPETSSSPAIPETEKLMVPLYEAAAQPLGTLWVSHHDNVKSFDAEDVRFVEHLAQHVVLNLKLCKKLGVSQQPSMPDVVAPTSLDPDINTNAFIRKLDNFVALSPEDRAALAKISAGARTIDASTDLIREGQTPDGIFLVMEGFACRYKLRSDGARQITNYLIPGDFSDVDGLLHVMHHSIATLSACKIVRIARDALRDLTEKHPAVAQALHMSSLVDEATLREWLMNIGRRSAEERIAHLFCELFTRMQAVGLVQDTTFRLPLTQFDLGDTIGLSYVHVNRTLQTLRQQGLIVLRGKTLTILNQVGLRSLAEFKPGYLQPAERTAQ
jgi:CRP-like cAMP-binding protein